MEDRILNCKDCGSEFAFTAREQQFFSEKGFTNQPARCRECRQSRRAQGSDARRGPAASHEAVCAACGVATTLPFRPRGDRPVYCRTCFAAQVPVGV
jgi:CxxC-x17-CxxC domain-containing protein